MSSGSQQTKAALSKVGTLKKSAGVSCCTISSAVQTVVDKTPGVKKTKPKKTPAKTTPTNSTPTNSTSSNATDVTFTGKFSLALAGANKTQVETATKKSLAKHFAVSEASVTTTATESRRLSEGIRKLAGTWSIEYSFTVPASQAKAVEGKVEATKTSMDALKTELKTQLIAAGVDASKVNAMTVTGFTGTKVDPKTKSTATTGTAPSTTSRAADAAIFSSAAAVMILLINM
jgi:hypothetical protein